MNSCSGPWGRKACCGRAALHSSRLNTSEALYFLLLALFVTQCPYCCLSGALSRAGAWPGRGRSWGSSDRLGLIGLSEGWSLALGANAVGLVDSRNPSCKAQPGLAPAQQCQPFCLLPSTLGVHLLRDHVSGSFLAPFPFLGLVRAGAMWFYSLRLCHSCQLGQPSPNPSSSDHSLTSRLCSEAGSCRL
jgi:hypothetical protein